MQILKVFRYSILALFMWSLPSFLLAYGNSSLGALSSVASIVLLLIYFIFENNKGPLPIVFVILGLLYYFIAGLNFVGIENQYYFADIIKYLIVIICGATVMRNSTLPEIYFFLVIGSLSIVINAILFPLSNANFYPTYGRFSGFYLNPNYAGAMSLIGFALSFGIKNKKMKYLGQLIFSIGGFFTLSRYFLSMWVLLNLLSVLVNRKNLIVPITGVFGLIFIFAFADKLSLKADRLNAYYSIFDSDTKVDTKTLENDSRTDTWGLYTDYIMTNPFSGYGYQKFTNGKNGIPGPGVHNTYLLVLGEAGLAPFILIAGIFFYFLTKGYYSFKKTPHFSMLSLVLFTSLMVTHNYFDKFTLLLFSVYLLIVYSEGSKSELE